MSNENEQKISNVKRLKKVAIILYCLELLFVVVVTLAVVIKMGVAPDLQKSIFLPTTLFLIINLITDNKKKAGTKMPWYRNKWSWLIVLTALPLPLLFLSFITSIGVLFN